MPLSSQRRLSVATNRCLSQRRLCTGEYGKWIEWRQDGNAGTALIVAEHRASRATSEMTPDCSIREGERATPPIGQLLIEAGLIGETDLARALAFQERYGGRLGSILVRLGALSEERLMPILSNQLSLPLLRESDLPADTAAYFEAIRPSCYPVDWWVDQEALPWFAAGELWVAARDPLMMDLQEFVSAGYLGTPIRWSLVAAQTLDRALDRVQQRLAAEGRNLSDEVGHLRELAEEAPVIELVNNLIGQAFAEGASDPCGTGRVRFPSTLSCRWRAADPTDPAA